MLPQLLAIFMFDQMIAVLCMFLIFSNVLQQVLHITSNHMLSPVGGEV